jgi:hypothetical protein
MDDYVMEFISWKILNRFHNQGFKLLICKIIKV